MDRVVWVAASPRGVSDDVRSVVSAALEVGFDEIVLFQPDASLQRLGRFSPILLKDSTFFLGDVEVGRLATIRSAKDEAPVRGLRGATKNVVIRPEPWKGIPLENLIAFFQGSGRGAARPFGVTGVQFQAYIYLPGGTTKYLSDLRGGDDIRAVAWKGRARSVFIGRVKIERRPFLFVEAGANDRRYSTIVQNA